MGVDAMWEETEMTRSMRYLMLAVAVLALAAAPASAFAQDGKTVVGPGDSIQAAVDAAVPGETIVVLRGTYRENVAIAKDGIRLLSLGARLEPPAAPEPNFCSDPGQPATIGICVAGKFDPDTGEVWIRSMT